MAPRKTNGSSVSLFGETITELDVNRTRNTKGPAMEAGYIGRNQLGEFKLDGNFRKAEVKSWCSKHQPVLTLVRYGQNAEKTVTVVAVS